MKGPVRKLLGQNHSDVAGETCFKKSKFWGDAKFPRE